MISSRQVTPEIVYEEERFFIVNKPSGCYSHFNFPGQEGISLVDCFRDRMDFPDSPAEDGGWDEGEEIPEGVEGHVTLDPELYALRRGLVHRLDRDTAGLVIMAKNPTALRALQDLFRCREVRKKYQALVHGHIFEHNKLLVHNLIRDPQHRSRRKVQKAAAQVGGRDVAYLEGVFPQPRVEEGRTAETLISPIAFFKDQTHIDIEIFTGRTHQIRVQLAHEGFPVVGDPLYGGGRHRRDHTPHEMMLCACFLEFINPFSGETITQEIRLPEYFTAYMGRLEKYQLSLKRK